MSLPNLHEDTYLAWIDQLVHHIAGIYAPVVSRANFFLDLPLNEDELQYHYSGFSVILKTKYGGHILLEKCIGLPNNETSSPFVREGLIVRRHVGKVGQLVDLVLEKNHPQGHESEYIKVTYRDSIFPTNSLLDKYIKNTQFHKDVVHHDIIKYFQWAGYKGFANSKNNSSPLAIWKWPQQ